MPTFNEIPKAEEDALMQQLLASVFMSVDAPVAIIALDGRFIAVNPAFSQMLRYGARGLEGHRFWDLISEEFGGNVAVDATESGKSGAAYAVDARIRLGDGSTATLRVSLTSIRQPQFKRFRLLAIREVSAPSAATPPSSFSTPNLREVVVAGNIQLVGLDLVKAALGKRWPAHAEKAMLVAEAILRNRLGPEDVFSRTEDRGFVICFAEGSEDAAAFRAAIIAREIRNRLIGDSDDPAGSSVTAVTLAVEIGPDQTENGRPVLSVLQQRLEAARSEAERRAAAELSVAMAVATLEPEPVFDNVGKSVPIVFVSLPGTLQEQIDVALATLPSTEGIDADLDVLKLTLSAEAALADIGAGRSAIYLLPVHFALFANRKRQERYVEICRKLQDIVRQRIIFMLSEVPRTASQSRLFEMIRLLKPFGKGVGMDLDSAEFIPTDLAQYRIPLVALSADELLDSARTSPSKLSRFIRQLRLNGTRLIARQVRGEAERSAVVSIGADLVSFTTRGGRTDSPLEQTPQNNLESWAFAAAIKSTKVAVVITNMKKPDNPITSCNPAFSEITGYTSEEVVGHNWRVLHGRGTDRGVVDEIREAVLGGAPIERELLMYRKDGTSILCNLVISPVHDDAGALVATVGLVTDVTALRRAEASRRAIARLFDDLVENIPGYIFQRTLTADGRAEYNYLSPSFKRLVGAPVGEPLRKPHPEWIHPDDAQAVSQAIQMSGEHLTPVTLEYRLICDDGQIRWVRTRSRPGRREDGTVVWNGVGLDISPEKSAEGHVSYLSGHDALTGLANRQRFHSRLCEILAETEAQGGHLAVLCVDLSDFRELSNAFGAEVGDHILKTVGGRIESFAGAKVVGRVATDVFTVALREIDSPIDALEKAQALCREIAEPIDAHGRSVTVLSTIGLALYPQHALEANVSRAAEALIKAADVALLTAKHAGPGACLAYMPENDDRIRNRTLLQQSLHAAFALKQFTLHYQPLVELDTGRILGAEALIRWQHPELGLQRPDQFIPIAEKSGLIVPMGTWVMEEALRTLQAWEASGAGHPRIAVNVAAAQLQHPDALGELRARIVDSGFNPRQIEIELTESEFIDPTPKMLENLQALRTLGVTVAIDDFGTGYSSFRYLRSLPIDKLKIDQSFIRNMVAGSGDEAIVRGMISIGRDLGLSVVVEGVETAEQRDILLRMGCSVGQGYFYSVPLTAEDFAWKFGQHVRLPMSGAAHEIGAPLRARL